MDDSDARRQMRRHLSLTRRIRALHPRNDSAEFAEGRLIDYAQRILDLKRLEDQTPDDIATLKGIISVSMKLLVLKRQQFNLPVVHSSEVGDDDLEDGGAGVPISSGPLFLSGSGGRLFTESEECNDW